MKRFLKEPLVHFMTLGILLFGIYGYFNKDVRSSDNPNRIIVDRNRILNYMQYRSKAFDANRFNATLDGMTDEKLDRVIRGYVQEEALYREAKALHLDRNDYLAHLRLIRQLEYITRGFIEAGTQLSEEEIQSYLDANKALYFVPAKVTFTHVFFNADRRGWETAERLARRKLHELNERHVPFHQAMSHGDRFLYQTNYVDKGADEIESQFGGGMQQQIFALSPDDTLWRGPFRSPYGFHLVMITKHTNDYDPPLSEIRNTVEQDALQARRDAAYDKAIQAIVDGFKVDILRPLRRSVKTGAEDTDMMSRGSEIKNGDSGKKSS